MRITVLLENTPGAPGCAFRHGLSLFIQTDLHAILMDAGPDEAFAQNARILSIPLEHSDICVLSHGHYDHAGGLLEFARIAPAAPIYMQRSAALDYYADDPGNLHYIGIDKAIAALPSVRLLDGDAVIDNEISLLARPCRQRLASKSNGRLKQLKNGKFVQDAFAHEQALVIHEQDKSYLFSGCSHNGIVNWLDLFRKRYGKEPDAVIGGFHFMKNGEYSAEEEYSICETANELYKTSAACYTGHCTGDRAFAMMKEIMGSRLHALHSGMSIEMG